MPEKTILELEGQVVAILVSADVGSATRVVVANPQSGVLRKSLGALSYEPIILKIGGDTTNQLLNWIADAWAHRGSKKSGAIVKLDRNGRDAGRVEFTNALLTETTLPAFDQSQPEPATLTLKLLPASTARRPASGAVVVMPTMARRPWLRTNFRLSIGGIDANRTVRTDAITVAVAAVRAADGSFNPGIVSVTNLAVTFPEISARDFLSWHKSFVIDGQNRPTDEKTGTIVMLSPDLRETYLTFTLHNIGIFRLVSLDPPAGGSDVSLMRAEMYVNQPDFGFPP